MQIHELTQRAITEASLADRVKTGIQNIQTRSAAANVAAGQAQQDKATAQAAKYAEILRKQGFSGQTAPAPTSAVGAGQRVLVVATQPNGTKANYYKTDKGWENELEQAVTDPTSIAYLEKLYATQTKPGVKPAGAVQTKAAGAVKTGGAPAVMTAGDFNSSLSQLNLNNQQLTALKQKIAQDPSFTDAFLRTLGLKR